MRANQGLDLDAPRRELRAIAAFGAAGVGLSAWSLLGGPVPACPFRSLTGLLCPLCGGTHLGVALLRWDLAAAWQANPLLFVGLLALACYSIGVLAETSGARFGAVSRWLRRARLAVRGTSAGWLFGVLTASFTLWRNFA